MYVSKLATPLQNFVVVVVVVVVTLALALVVIDGTWCNNGSKLPSPTRTSTTHLVFSTSNIGSFNNILSTYMSTYAISTHLFGTFWEEG